MLKKKSILDKLSMIHGLMTRIYYDVSNIGINLHEFKTTFVTIKRIHLDSFTKVRLNVKRRGLRRERAKLNINNGVLTHLKRNHQRVRRDIFSEAKFRIILEYSYSWHECQKVTR